MQHGESELSRTFEAFEEGGFVVTFPRVPEAITQGDDEGEGLRSLGHDLLRASGGDLRGRALQKTGKIAPSN
jgi:hypothetical protein